MSDNKNKHLKIFMDGILTNNPTLVQLIGMCPTLAVSTSVKNGIGMGLSATFVLVCSNVLISLLRKFIPPKIRIAAYVVVIAGFVTIIDLLIKAYLPELSKSLGIFIPLIVVNCIILARAEAFASKNSALESLTDGLGMGAGFTLALIMLSSVREILGAGSWLGFKVFGDGFQPAMIIAMPPGGFLMLGMMIAFVGWVINRYRSKNGTEEV